MKRNLLCLLASVFAFSCTMQEGPVNDELSNKQGVTFVSASLDENVKTTLGALVGDKRSVYWSNGDVLNINGASSEALTDVQEQQGTATFKFNEELSYPYKAIYPASIYKSENTVTLPARQAWANGTFATNTAPAAAYMTMPGNLALKNLCGVVKFKLLQQSGGDTDKIASVAFKSNNNEKVSGDFSIDYNKLAIEEANSTLLAEQTVTVTVNQGLSTSQALEVYVVVPAREYTKGFTLTIIDQNGHTMEVAKASSINVVAGQILSMSTPVEFEPTFTSIIIDTPSKLNAFAKAFNNGEYDVDVDVKVISDLEYDATTSADFTTIGNGTYVYAGVFDGGGYSIKGLTTGNSLFYLPNGATIKNVVYDQSCVITHPASLGGNWGILGRAFQGSTKAENCVINCDVKLYYSNVASAETGLGVITGRLDHEASIENCVVNGDINYVNNGQSMPKAQNIGGLVGWLNGVGTRVTNSSMNGNLNFPAQSGQTATSSTSADLYIGVGGIAGKAIGSENVLIKNCQMNGDIIWGDYLLSISLGGICGWATCDIDSCTVNRNMTVNVPCVSATGVSYVRAFYGGIAGRLQGVVSNCKNASNNDMVVNDSHNSVCVGGIAGKMFEPANIINCSNSSNIKQTATTASGDMQFGGIAGNMEKNTTITSAINSGMIEVKCPKPVNSSNLDVGGIVGKTRSAISGGTVSDKVSAVHNKGQIRAVLVKECVNFGFLNIGGVAGRSEANLTNLTNAGLVHVDCNAENGTLNIFGVHEGGIVGRVTADITVSGCVNNAETRYYGGAASNLNRTCIMGGIVGSTIAGITYSTWTVTGTKAIIDNCHNYGKMTSTNFNTNYPQANMQKGNYIGGIVGALKGVDTNNRATVSNCTRSLANGQRIGDANFDSGYRGYISGIAGGSWSANITKCTNSAYMKNNAANAERVSGIVGIAADTTIDGCVLDADIENGACLAGICSGANSATLIIKNCKVNATLKSAKGTTCAAIAHNIETGLQILNCQIKGGYETASGSATWTGAEGDFYIAKSGKTVTFTGNSLWK